MPLQTLPTEAASFYNEQQRIMRVALAAAARIWGDRAPADFDRWFAEHYAALVELVMIAQARTVDRAVEFVPIVLEAQGSDVAAVGELDTSGLVGVAGDGRALDTLMSGAVISAKAAIKAAPETNPAVERAAWAEKALGALLVRMQTAIADSSRQAAGLATIARPRTAYVRMLNPPSCSRCAVLAGRKYRSSSAFLRHPRCDCRNIPVPEAAGMRDLTVDSAEYFQSLTGREQDRIFTKAGAQAIRDGADINQVVNARRGADGLDFATGRITAAEREAIRGSGRGRLQKSEVPGGRMLSTTTEGVTKRGYAYTFLQGKTKRLMPEAIYQVADNRAEALRLLERYGYIV